MNIHMKSMRTVLAAAAAGALIIGSASGAVAAKPDTKPAPQKNDRLVSVSIKGSPAIDLKSATADTAINLRAKLWDPQRDSGATTVKLTLGVYTKKVGGNVLELGSPPAAAPRSLAASLTLNPADATKKVKRYTAAPKVLGDLWTVEQVKAVADALDPMEKAFICIATAEVSPTVKNSNQVQKRLGERKGKAVRDCVKVIDSSPVTP